jgi:hypothetical protein
MQISKVILLILFTLLSCTVLPLKGIGQIQTHTQSPIPKGDEILSTKEAELLNSLLEQSRNTFDFHGKKIAFITGSNAGRILSKADYFNTCVTPWLADGKTPQIFMVELTGEEKNKSGGYDAFVLSWVKVFTDKRKKKVIEQLSKS